MALSLPYEQERRKIIPPRIADTAGTAKSYEKTTKGNKFNMGKVLDKALGVDYSYMLKRELKPTQVINDEEIEKQESEIMKAFLEANKNIESYIDKSYFDPTAIVARHILDLIKDTEYKVKVGEKEYPLAQVIMLKAMGECYKYVTDVAKKLAEQTNNKNSIVLHDDDVFTIAENYFKHGDSKAEITTDEKKTAPKKKETKPVDDNNDMPEEVEAPVETSKQISFFDL